MEKPATPDYPILDLLKRRWSPRAFSDRPVEPQKLRCVLEAARWAASSFNEQPWIFFLAQRTDSEAFEKALSCLVEANRLWAKEAPVLLLTAVRTDFTRNGKPNRVAQHDLGLAMGNLVTQATAMDLFVHQMAGIDLDRMRDVYQLPAEYEPQTAAALGYAGNPGQLPEALAKSEQGPRTRKPLPEFVFGQSFGEPSSIVKTRS